MTAFEDREKRAAIAALVRRLQNRGDADDEPFAAEFITALWGRGWRPVEVLRPPLRTGPATGPNEAYREARALVDERAAVAAFARKPLEASGTAAGRPGEQEEQP